MMLTYLVLVNNRALEFIIITFFAIPLFDYLVDLEMLEPCGLRKLLTVRRFPDTWRAGHDNIR